MTQVRNPAVSSLRGTAVKRPKRLFTKHRSLQCERRRIGADACPVPEGHAERLAFERSLEAKREAAAVTITFPR